MDGQLNAFFGVNAGINNSTGCCNSFFGNLVGVKNKTGRSNAFFGGAAGIANTTGSFNAFFGDGAGSDFFDPNAERTGDLNTAVGFLSGSGIKAGSSNTFLGSHASAASDVSNATAIGANALVTQSNTLVLGNSASVGIGTSTPASKLTVVGVIESTFGGFKFPDGSVQTSAAVGGGGVPSGSPNYIQSNPSSQQAGVSFNIGGNGTAGGTLSANVVSAATQYNLGGQRIMSVQPAFQSTFLGQNAGVVNNAAFNSFFGSSAGAANTSGLANSFFGDTAGGKNVDGGANSAFGSGAGFSNISGTFNSSFGYHSGINSVGSFNSFFGAQAGASNTVGGSSFFGALAGQNNTTGIQNSFFGYNAGNANATGCCNSFFGFQAGQVSTGDDNSFFGNNAGAANTTGNQNSFFGSGAGFMNNQGSFNSFFGLSAGRANTTGGLNTFVGDSAGLANNGSHNSFFGANAGKNNTTGLFNSFFGRSAGFSSNGDSNVFFGAGAGDSNTTGGSNTFVGTSAGHSNATGGNHTLLGRSADVGVDGLTNATAIGANALVTQSNTLVLGSINGVNGAAADTNVGIGTSAPGSKLTVVGLIESKAGGIKFPDGTVQTSAAAGGSAITQITAGAGLTGGGTTGNVTLSVGAGQGISVAPGAVSIADLGVTTAKLSDAAVTGPKIALGQVVRNINGLTDSVTLAAGANITITPAGNTLTIASTGGGGGGSILNQTALQAAANFNIDGAGKASVFDAATQYNLVGQRVLSIARTEGPDYDNVYVGPGAGALASSDNNSFFGFKAGAGAVVVGGNSFFGSQAGERDTGGALNSFFGYQSGRDNTTGPDNCFFGASAGTQNDVGRENSFFGFSAGFFNQSGGQNSYFGSLAGSNSSGSGNTFVGANAGNNVTPGMVDTGNDNTAVGLNAGNSNISGSNNTALGANAQATSTSSALSNTTAVGAFAQVTRDNALVLGSINGVNGATADTIVGIGTTNPLTRLHVVGDVTLSGNVNISGALVKPAGSFKIDHPLDPENKTLSHSFVESPDMKNIYDGVVKLDSNGEAIVTLPEYFQALNREFRYQLTAIGAPGPNLYVAEEVSNNRFKIAGGKPGSKVSWQVTGVRHDAYADAHRIKVEEDKPALERGYYLHPDLFGQSEEKGVEWARHPEMMQRLKDRREQTQSHGIRP
jgi:hypothetical protein